MRCSPQADRDNRSAYELVVGLIPQGPLDHIWRTNEVKHVDPNTYVEQLRSAMQGIYQDISVKIHADAQKFLLNQRERGEVPHEFHPGDWVFLKKPPFALRASVEVDEASPSSSSADVGASRASRRLAPYADTRLYRINKIVKCSSVVLSDMYGNTDLSFMQPVHMSRLIPYNLAVLETPVHDDSVLKLELRTRSGIWHKACIESQTATGLVRLAFDTHADLNGLYDLASEEYRWTQ